MHDKELILKALEDAVEGGAGTIKEAAEKTGTPCWYAYRLQSFKEKKKELILKALEDAVEGGAGTIKEAAEKVGISYWRARKLLPFFKEKKSTKKVQLNKYVNKIRILKQALAEGVNSIEELCKRTHLKPLSLMDFSNKNKIPIPYDNMIPYPVEPEIDNLIPEGSFAEIGRRINKSRQYAYKYTIATAQHKTYKNLKPKRKQTYESLADLLNKIIDDKAKIQGWPTQKVVEYIRSLNTKSFKRIQKTNYYEKLITIFKRYKDAEKSGIKLSLEQLGECLYCKSWIGRILERVGLDPFIYGKREKL